MLSVVLLRSSGAVANVANLVTKKKSQYDSVPVTKMVKMLLLRDSGFSKEEKKWVGTLLLLSQNSW